MTDIIQNTNFSEDNILISFEGVAWGCGFYIGVYKALIDRYGYDKIKKMKFAGTSSGALTACVCCLGIDWKILYDYYKTLSDVCEKYGPIGKVSIYYHFVIKYIFDSSPTVYQNLNNRLFIGITCFFNKNKIISNWNSNQEVINTLNESMNIPIYCTYIPNVLNTNVIDGAVSKCFVIDKELNTITVSYIDSKADITGHDEFKYKDLYTAMPINRLNFIVELGYHRTRGYFSILDSLDTQNLLQHFKNTQILSNKKYNNFIILGLWIMFLIAKFKKYYFYFIILFFLLKRFRSIVNLYRSLLI